MPKTSRGRRGTSVARQRRAKPRLAWLAPALIAIAAALLLRLRPHPETSPPPQHPAERLSAQESNRQGLRLARQGRPLEATAYFRRVLALRPYSWFAHQNYAGALGNGAQEARLHLGKEEIATRSSVERVAMLRESLRETVIAESLATPSDQATVLIERARALYTWGFPLEALGFYRSAAALAPERRALVETVAQVEGELREGGR
jgi:tetratricopeptide (TPR) repeat protein